MILSMNLFESFSDKDKKDILLYGDSRLDKTKNKFILKASVTYIPRDSVDLFLNKNLTR